MTDDDVLNTTARCLVCHEEVFWDDEPNCVCVQCRRIAEEVNAIDAAPTPEAPRG